MWKIAKPRNLVGDVHPVEGQLGQETVLFHLARNHVRVELRDEASRTVVLYYLDHALRHISVLKDIFFEIISVNPFNFCGLRPVLGDIVVGMLFVHELLDKIREFLLWIRDVEHEPLILFEVELLSTVDLQLVEAFRLHFFLGLGVNDVHVWKLFWHLLHVKVLICLVVVTAVVHIEHIVIVSQG